MRHSNQGWFQQQFRFLRHQFLQDGDLPFSNVLSKEIVAQALSHLSPVSRPKQAVRPLAEFRAKMPSWRKPSATLLREIRNDGL